MLISPISHWFCWPLIPKCLTKQWNYVYGEIRSIGLHLVIFPGVKLIHKNVSSLEQEHSTSQGEYFCKEIHPSREGARTTYVWGKNDPRAMWVVQKPCAAPRGSQFPPQKDTKHAAMKNPQSITAATKPLLSTFLFPGWNYSDYIMAAGESEEERRSQQEL